MINADQIFTKLRAQLFSNPDGGIHIPGLESDADDVEIARADILYRFTKVYTEFLNKTAGHSDILVLLRQIVRTFGPIRLNSGFWSLLRGEAAKFKLIEETLDENTVQIIADNWKAHWLPDSERIDNFEPRRVNETAPGDGLINAMHPLWTTYRSEAQKAAVDAWMFAAPGSTTLVTLPTGEGKSLCTILLPWFDAQGGTSAKGTTLVIVPTVALAHDQQKQAQFFFPNARGDFFEPWSRTGDTSTEIRQEIERAILDGTLPILYTSPESLIQSRLYGVCLQAARAGYITRLVIDEAHLVETWGAGFRIEFQLLATYRRMLIRESKGQLRTLLLSATVPRSGFDVLAKLFSEEDNLITVQANRLRSEIEYYFDYSHSQKERERKIFEAIRILPRPLLLYVTQPRQAQRWLNLLHQENYMRVQAFHGETPNTTRQKLIRDWDENKLDIMVATSAFGLGVDKRHVRSVVHATAPENLDRLYQEVGRGGRDGCRSISLVSIIEADKDLASALLPRRLTFELAHQRWLHMKETAEGHPEKDGVILVDRDATRKDAPKMRVGDTNQDWNFHMLLLMQRAGMIEIAEVPPVNPNSNDDVNWLPIRLLKPEIFNSKAAFKAVFERTREDEQADINQNRNYIFNLVKSYAIGKSPKEGGEFKCLAANIGRMYERAQLVCSGCPICRQNNNKYIYPAEATIFRIDYPEELAQVIKSKVALDEDILTGKMGSWKQFNLTWGGTQSMNTLVQWLPDIAMLFWKGFEQIIYPSELLADPDIRDAFIKQLATPPGSHRVPYQHRLIPHHWLMEKNTPLFALNTLVIYPTETITARKLHQRVQETEEDNIHIPSILNILHENQRFDDGRPMQDILDGITEPIEWYIAAEEEIEDDDIPLF